MLMKILLTLTCSVLIAIGFNSSLKIGNRVVVAGRQRPAKLFNHQPRVEFEYCTGCRWLLRSAWMAQELLTTFEKEIGEVALIPCKNEPGTFIVRLNGVEIWNRKISGFPDIKELKQLVRDGISPDRSLGHTDK